MWSIYVLSVWFQSLFYFYYILLLVRHKMNRKTCWSGDEMIENNERNSLGRGVRRKEGLLNQVGSCVSSERESRIGGGMW